MSLVTENYNYFVFHIALTKYMSEDNIPQKTPCLMLSESALDVRMKLLKNELFARRSNERDRDRWDRVSLIKSEVPEYQ